ncbi:MAG: sensor histidine kinase [Blautia sp.]|nr:sensor histidine kinase [Blautia sp.]
MRGKNTSLESRLHLLMMVCFLPLACIAIYLLVMTYQVSARYDAIVENITKANEYNTHLKEEVDYTMYVVVVNSERAAEIVDVDAPRNLIKGARETFTGILGKTEEENGRNKLNIILKCLNSLEKGVEEIERDAGVSGMYDTNLEHLDLNIRILTELVQESIQEYIYYAATNLELLRDRVGKDVKNAMLISSLLCITTFAIAFVISRRMQSSMTKGIRELRMVTRKAGQGDFSVRAHTDDNYEDLQELEEGFNHMVERIGNLVEDIKTEQVNQRLTEQRLLQAQINPHFLYNTLDAIIWQAEAGEKEQVVTMVTALSDFFRTTLSKGRDYISVREEESHIRSYLQIQRFRYQDILEYEIRIPEEMYQYQILKLTLQPLVENALYHGIKNKRGMGYIEVSGRMNGMNMEFHVKDNGMGMTEERLSQVRKEMYQEREENIEPSVFGLFNVVERIRLNYGLRFGVEIVSVFGEGTDVIVQIPAKKIETFSKENQLFQKQ